MDKSQEKKATLSLGKSRLEIDRDVIIESINNNKLNWQLQKSVEECVQLSGVLLKAKKNVVANEHICQAIADTFIQITILEEMYGASNIQLFINDRLSKIKNRNKKLRHTVRKVGFTNVGDDG